MKKIMFNDRYCLTEAILHRRKTMTRRIENFNEECSCFLASFSKAPRLQKQFIAGSTEAKKMQYKLGEVVAVAQDYCSVYKETHHPELQKDEDCAAAGWRNKMFVRADLMPHQIRITNIRVERLQDITDADCLKEGIDCVQHCGIDMFGFFDNQKDEWILFDTPREAFASLIDKVSRKGTWEHNPIVCAYELELVK